LIIASGYERGCNMNTKDLLRVEGILFKGFGHIPKFIMLDTDLTIEAKGIYAYFCSFAGSGNSAFPSRDKILKDLSIGKDRYYKHYNLLILNGYLSAEQERRKDEKTGEVYLGNNIYTLIANPKKYVEKREQEDLHKNKGYSRIRNSGMKSLGYGTIAKAPMLDNRLPLQAKAIYAYFCSFAGSGNSAFPKLSNILYHLQISEKTYYKYYGELVKFNYITPIQRNIKGRFSVNDYYINETPDEELVESKPFSKNSDTEKSIDNPSSLPFSKNSDTEKSIDNPSSLPFSKNSDTQKPYTQKPYTQKSDTNNTNSFNTNSIYYNQSINHTLLNKVEKNDRLIEKYSLDYIKEMLETEVYAMDRHDNLYGELTNLVYDVVNETRDTIKINGNLLPTEVVRSRFLKLTPGNLLYVIEVFKKQTTKVNNIRQYLITALYNSFSTLDSYYTNAVNHDLYGA